MVVRLLGVIAYILLGERWKRSETDAAVEPCVSLLVGGKTWGQSSNKGSTSQYVFRRFRLKLAACSALSGVSSNVLIAIVYVAQLLEGIVFYGWSGLYAVSVPARCLGAWFRGRSVLWRGCRFSSKMPGLTQHCFGAVSRRYSCRRG
jgi:hypothetical protein